MRRRCFIHFKNSSIVETLWAAAGGQGDSGLRERAECGEGEAWMIGEDSSPGHEQRLFRAARECSVLMVLLPMLAAPAGAYEREIKSAASQMAAGMEKAGKKSIAIVDFTDLQGNVTELGRFLAEQLSVAIALEGGSFEVVDRSHLKALLQEHKLSASGLIDPQTARKLGQLTGVEALGTGSVTPFGDSINLSVKLLDTNTARLVAASSVEIPRTKAIEELLARGIGLPESGVRQDSTRAEPSSEKERPPRAVDQRTHSAAPMTASADDLEATLQECTKTNGTASCRGTIRNTGRARQRMGFETAAANFGRGARRDCEAVDDAGAQSSSCVVSLGSGASIQDLEPDTPLRFTVSRIEVSPAASFITLTFKVRGSRAIGGFSGGSGSRSISFRRVPLAIE